MSELTLAPTVAPTLTSVENNDEAFLFSLFIIVVILWCWCSYRFFGGRRHYVQNGDFVIHV